MLAGTAAVAASQAHPEATVAAAPTTPAASPETISTYAGGGAGDGGAASAAGLSYPGGMAMDSRGNLYVADELFGRVREISPNGTIRTVAGNAEAPPAPFHEPITNLAPTPAACWEAGCGDGGPAVRATLNQPSDVALDAGDDLFISDTGDGRVRKVSPDGVISTVAGGGSFDFCDPVKILATTQDLPIVRRLGDGGPATSACLPGPGGIVVDALGALFIAEPGLCRVRRVDTRGIITTVAGNGTCQESGDGGTAKAAGLNGPDGIAVDAQGDVFISDWWSGAVRKVTSNGVISTVAGRTACYPDNDSDSGDGGPATGAGLCGPDRLRLDAAGDLYIADRGGNRLRRVDAATQIITTVAGDGVAAFGGDGGPATAAAVRQPDGMALSGAGDLLVSEWPDRVRRVDHATGLISTIAGNGSGYVFAGWGDGYSGDGLPATAATLQFPQAEAVGPDGNLYIADTSNNRVRVVDHQTGIITTIAGNGLAADTGDGGPAISASLDEPAALAFDASGDLYAADAASGGGRVRRIDHASGVITSVAGGGSCAGSSTGDGGPATDACLQLRTPAGLAVDTTGNVYIADAGHNTVREVAVSSDVITTVVGNGTFSDACGPCGDGGPATSASIWPMGLTFDAAGNLYIADAVHDRVREVNSSGVITAYAGSLQRGPAGDLVPSYSGDGGPATSATMLTPYGIAFDNAGDLFIAAGGNHAVRMVNAQGVISTVAGVGEAGLGGDGGPPTEAQLNGPGGVAVGPTGVLYIVDSGNGRIRAVSPLPSNAAAGAPSQLRTRIPPARGTDIPADPQGQMAPAQGDCTSSAPAARAASQPTGVQPWEAVQRSFFTAAPMSSSLAPTPATTQNSGPARDCMPSTGHTPTPVTPASAPLQQTQPTSVDATRGTSLNWSELSNGTPMGSFSTMTFDPHTNAAVALALNPPLDAASTWAIGSGSWKQQRQTTVSPHLLVASLAYDDATKSVVLFGGIGFQEIAGAIYETAVDETWTWNGEAWTEAHPLAAPPATLNAAMAYDAATRQVVLFGGYVVDPATGGLVPSGQTWVWNGTTWSRAETAAHPSPRAGAVAAYDSTRHRVVLFGGFGGNGCTPNAARACGDQSDTWTWDGTSWSQVASSGPPARAVEGLADDATTHTVVLFGGAFDNSDGTFTAANDTWSWNGSNWAAQHPADVPDARAEPAMSFDGNGVGLFGGETIIQSQGFLDDTWTWNGADWAADHATPSPRDGAAAAFDQQRNQLVVFGGDRYPSEGITQLVAAVGETWTWDASSGWRKQHPSRSPSPGAYGTMAYDGATGQVVLLEGQGCGHLASDCTPGDPGCTAMASCTWTWNGTTWTQQHPAHSPPPLATATMSYDAATGDMVLFGGVAFEGCGHYLLTAAFANASVCAVNDTWTWDGHDWTQRHPAHSPLVRWEAGMGYDDATQQVVLFGGWARVDGGGGVGGFLQDTWTWDGADWTVRSPIGGPPITRTGGLAYSAHLGKLVMFGGMYGYAEDFWDYPDFLMQNTTGDSYFLNSTWTWDGSAWTQLAPRTSPPGRGYMGAVASPNGILVFGGTNIFRYNDLWQFGA